MARRPLGVQSFTYREFSNDEIRTELAELPISEIELCGVHVDPKRDSASEIRREYQEAGVNICGFGVVDFDDAEEVTSVVEFTDSLGADYLSVHVEESDADIVEALNAAAKQQDILIGVHNHGPDHFVDSVETVLELLEGTSPRFGACVDTGHFLRSDQTPRDVIPRLGELTHAVHIKDFDDDGVETIPGTGRLDVSELLELFDQHTRLQQPLVIEYELDAENPTPAVQETADRLLDAMGTQSE